MKCLNCNSEKFEENSFGLEPACVSCGVICETYNAETNIEFVETNFGESEAVGSFHYSGNISKFRTIGIARKDIGELCTKLNLPDSPAEKALKFYSILLKKNKTKGNSRLMTVGACIYLAARLEFYPIVLLDVSDKINVSVYRLGKLYKKLKRILGLEIQIAYPSVFVDKIVGVLKFSENKENEIVQTALKILKIIHNDDLISRGNPKMIATAAVIISAKLNTVDVEYDNIEKTLGIHPNTVDMFINKWKNSPSSDLTLAEFKNITLTQKSNGETIEYEKYEIKHSTQLESDSGEDIDLSGSDSDENEKLFLIPKSQ